MPRRRDSKSSQKPKKPVPAERVIFAENFRKARKAANLSQREIKEKTGFAQSWISRLETGKSTPKLDSMAKLAKSVGVPLWQLLISPS